MTPRWPGTVKAARPGPQWVWRRWWVVLVSVVGVPVIASALMAGGPRRYRATALFVVPATSSRSPSEAQKLAATYALLIPQDNVIDDAIASQAKVAPSTAARRLQLQVVPNTQLLSADYTAASEAEALASQSALVQAITGMTPASGTILPDSLQVVSRPSSATPISNQSKTTVPVAVILGLVLAAVLVVALERGDARIDTDQQLRDLVDWPVAPVEPSGGGLLLALVAQWSRPRNPRAGAVIALVPVDRTAQDVGGQVATMITALVPASARGLSAGGVDQGDLPGLPPRVVAGEELGLAGSGELVAMNAGSVAITVAAGTRQRRFVDTVHRLEVLGIEPICCLFLTGRLLGARPSAGTTDALALAAGRSAGPSKGTEADSTSRRPAAGHSPTDERKPASTLRRLPPRKPLANRRWGRIPSRRR